MIDELRRSAAALILTTNRTSPHQRYGETRTSHVGKRQQGLVVKLRCGVMERPPGSNPGSTFPFCKPPGVGATVNQN